MSEYIETDFADWSRRHFKMLADGGIWVVPRSGLTFTKRTDRLVLTKLTAGFTVLGAAADYLAIKYHFELAGIPVSDQTGLVE